MSLRTTQGREELRQAIAKWLDIPLLVAAIFLLIITIIDFTVPLSPDLRDTIERIAISIWLVFLADFVVEFILAASKTGFLRNNWIVAVSVVIPFFRVLTAAHIVASARPFWLARISADTNRAINEIRQALGGRQFVFVTLVVTIIGISGATALYFFERNIPGSPFQSLPQAFWYTVTIITTVGGERNPVTFEGRVVAFILMVTGMSLFGYIAGSIASYFVRRDVGEEKEIETATEQSAEEILAEIRLLRQRLDEIYPSLSKKTKERSFWDRILRRN